MAQCDNTHTTPSKACSGKCMGSACDKRAPRVWVVAACEGMISVFEKNSNGAVVVIAGEEGAVFSSLSAFQQSLEKAEHTHAFDQLIIVGGGNDIAWIHASLPLAATHHIAAEIEYPLLPAWFKQSLPLIDLSRALEHMLAA